MASIAAPALTHFLPRHFQHVHSSSSSSSSQRPNESYCSTASDSSTESPASASPLSFPLHKRHLSLPTPALSSVATLLPSPPNLARQSSKDAHCAPGPAHPPRQLFINTAITRPGPAGQWGSSSPSSSVSPQTASSLPAVSSMHLGEQALVSRSEPSTPIGRDDPPELPTWRVEVDDVVDLTAVPEPKTPVVPLRRVPDVTPPPSPSAPSTDFSPLSSSSSLPSLSSALAASFTVEPSLPELLASISMVVHVQLIKDRSSPLPSQLRLPSFHEDSSPSSSSHPSPPSIPSVRSIYQFLLHVFQRGRFSSELGLLALVYVHRVMAGTGVSLTPANWRPLMMASLCLAQKMWDDTPLINSDFRLLYPQLTLASASKAQFMARFNRLEADVCEALHFNFLVTSDTYALYLGELQSIWREYEQGHHQHQQQRTTAPQSGLVPPHVQQQRTAGAPFPKKEHGARLAAHRHHPYAAPASHEHRVLHRLKHASDSASDSEGHYDSDGDHAQLAGGWDPTVLIVSSDNGERPMAQG